MLLMVKVTISKNQYDIMAFDDKIGHQLECSDVT